jgi:hypothetical protein
VAHLWHSFLELHQARGGNGFGPNALSFSEIEAWQRLTGRCLTPWELNVMLALDRAYLASIPAPKAPKDD